MGGLFYSQLAVGVVHVVSFTLAISMAQRTGNSARVEGRVEQSIASLTCGHTLSADLA